MAQPTCNSMSSASSVAGGPALRVQREHDHAPPDSHVWTVNEVRERFLRNGELVPPIRWSSDGSEAGRLRDLVLADLSAKVHADATRRAYGRHVESWLAWAADQGVCPLPADPADLAHFVVSYALVLGEDGSPVKDDDGAYVGRVVTATVNQFQAALARLHALAELPSPTDHPYLQSILRGLRRVLTDAPMGAKVALTWDLMEELLSAPVPARPMDTRNALIRTLRDLTGATAGQICRMRREDLEDHGESIVVRLAPVRRGGTVQVCNVVRGEHVTRLREVLSQWEQLSSAWPGELLVRHRSGSGLTRQGVHKVLSAAPSPPARGLASVIRDRTLLIVGWNSALRRSNLAALTWDQLLRTENGWLIFVARSKTDQTGEGATIYIAPAPGGSDIPDPVAALEEWLGVVTEAMGGIDPRTLEGVPVFGRVNRYGHLVLSDGRPVPLSGEAVNDVVQRWAAAAGLDRRVYATTGGIPTRPGRAPFGAHSLRAGWITEARRQNVPDDEAIRHTLHKTVDSLRTYQRPPLRSDVLTTARVLGAIANRADVDAAVHVRTRRRVDWSLGSST